jgi:hypothetical protein
VGALASGVGDGSTRLSLDSFRLFSRALNNSTRSLHCSSSCRNDSKRAFSVEEAGRYVVGLRRAL